MESQHMSLGIDDDIAETQKLLTVVTRPIVRDRLIQLLGSLQQVHALRCHFSSCPSWAQFVIVNKASQAAFTRVSRPCTPALTQRMYGCTKHIAIRRLNLLILVLLHFFYASLCALHTGCRALTLGHDSTCPSAACSATF